MGRGGWGHRGAAGALPASPWPPAPAGSQEQPVGKELNAGGHHRQEGAARGLVGLWRPHLMLLFQGHPPVPKQSAQCPAGMGEGMVTRMLEPGPGCSPRKACRETEARGAPICLPAQPSSCQPHAHPLPPPAHPTTSPPVRTPHRVHTHSVPHTFNLCHAHSPHTLNTRPTPRARSPVPCTLGPR